MSEIFQKIIIPLLLGAAIGFERNAQDYGRSGKNKTYHEVGIRTFSIISFLGSMSGIIFPLFPAISVILISSCIIMITGYYFMQSKKTGDFGITTELALIFSLFSGITLSLGVIPSEIMVASTVVLILLLSKKQLIKNIILNLTPGEISAFVSYALIALVVLPFLPNRYYTLSDFPAIAGFFSSYGINLSGYSLIEIINPFRLWFIVALVTGVDLLGHMIEKFAGARGRIAAGLIGGFVSSTATTQSLAQESATSKHINPLVAAAIFANMTSFIQLFVLITPVNPAFLVKATPLIILLILSSLSLGIFFSRKGVESGRKKNEEIKKQQEVLSVAPAIKFALIFLTVRIVSKIALQVFGNTGFLVTSAISALTGIDAVVINIAEMSGRSISPETGIAAIILVNFVNLSGKSFYSFSQGKREFAYKFGISMLIIVLASLPALLS